jgi:pyruvate formate lyase activating enzyme
MKADARGRGRTDTRPKEKIVMTEGLVFDIKKFALHDGPGIRTTVFFKGCPLRCAWCHNPEGQLPVRELMVRRSRCIRCGACAPCCENDAIEIKKDGPHIVRGMCKVCGACAEACNSDAVQLVGKWMTAKEVMAEVLKDTPFYEQSGGGVTFSGGEPLAQPIFLRDLLKASKRAGLHTTVDTCGHGPWKALDSILAHTDTFLYDLKHMDDRRHRQYTGVSNKRILQNLERLAKSRAKIIVRYAVVPGINDDDKNIREMAKFVAKLKRIERIDVLPFHTMALEKYSSLNRNEGMAGVKLPTKENLRRIAKTLEERGLKVMIGG